MFRILWDPSSGSIKLASVKLLVMFVCVVGDWQREIWTCGVCVCCAELRTTVVVLNTNITSNFSEARSTLPEDGSQRIRNMSEFLIGF